MFSGQARRAFSCALLWASVAAPPSPAEHATLASALQRAEALALRRRSTFCHRLLHEYLSPPQNCYIRVPEVASKLAFQVARTDVLLPNDVYAISSLQQHAIVLLHACRSQVRESEWAAKRSLSLMSRAFSVPEFLAEENAQRRRWTERLARFLWLNYEERAFPAPEMDPRSGRESKGEWTTEPMFVLDNLDALHMFKLDASLDRMTRWIELSTIIVETISGKNNYVRFAQTFEAPLNRSPPNTNCTQQTLYMLTSSWIQAALPEEAATLTDLLTDYLDACFPYKGPHTAQVSTEDLLHIIRSSPEYMPSFQGDQRVSFFEFTIRGFGGLLSAFQLRGHPILLYKAWDAGFRMSYAIFSCYGDTPRELFRLRGLLTRELDNEKPCVPSRDVAWKAWSVIDRDPTQKIRISTPAVSGSNQLEYAALSELTSICLFKQQSQNLMSWMLSESRMPDIGLFPMSFSASREGPKQLFHGGSVFGIGAEADSMFEYLLKGAAQPSSQLNTLLTASVRKFAHVFPVFLDSVVNSTDSSVAPGFTDSVPALRQQHHGSAAGTLRLGTEKSPLQYQNIISVRGGPERTAFSRSPEHTHLGCFSAGMVSLMSEVPVLGNTTAKRLRRYGEQLAESCAAMYLGTTTGIGGEGTRIHSRSPSLSYHEKMGKIRPEVLEGLTYQYHATGKQKYRNLAWKLLDATMANARVVMGLCSIDDTTQFPARYAACRQDTWILAETMKYYLLIFSPADKIKNELIRPLTNLTAVQDYGHAAVRAVMNESTPGDANPSPLAKIRDALFGPGMTELATPIFRLPVTDLPQHVRPDVFVPRLDSVEDFGDIAEFRKLRRGRVNPLVDGMVLNTEAHPFLGLPFYPCSASENETLTEETPTLLT